MDDGDEAARESQVDIWHPKPDNPNRMTKSSLKKHSINNHNTNNSGSGRNKQQLNNNQQTAAQAAQTTLNQTFY